MSLPQIHAALSVLTVFGGVAFVLAVLSSLDARWYFGTFAVWALLWAALAATR